MMRRRAGPPPGAAQEDDSSSDEDVFSKLSRKQQSKKQKKNPPTPADSSKSKQVSMPADANVDANPPKPAPSSLPLATTSSMKRHHNKMSGSRKAKMDALLQELEQEKKLPAARDRSQQHYVPHKKGSFVEPGQEHVTTNIFVGNLAPNLTEEEVTNVFRQFGDLYSVKIMWPRTAEERARQRHTGFVCFMHRADAEEAMAYCDNADPFNVGRRLVLRWGKNVKKVTKQGVGGVAIAPIQKRALAPAAKGNSSRQPVYDPAKHSQHALHVKIPASRERARIISTVASFVAKDGSVLEQMLELEGNPQYSFLRLPPNPTPLQKDEHLYYRWRVYSFTQGDGFYKWRAEPFVMFRPHGCFWIPPPMDQDAAQQEVEHKQREEERLERQKQERTARRGFATGRQLERARKGGPDGGGRLSREEMEQFNVLFRQKLSFSRESICVAMAFCFEKSGAARQISELLKELLTDEAAGIGTRVARLYLLSDILFNSQQPGVKNAFLYRGAIERDAPDIFTSLGKGGRGSRISQNKLATAVSRVLSAWTAWSVYTPTFLDRLQDLFEGKEIKTPASVEEDETVEKEELKEEPTIADVIAPNDADFVSTRQQGEWKEVSHADDVEVSHHESIKSHADRRIKLKPKALNDESQDALEADPDGDPFDADGELPESTVESRAVDALASQADGEPVDPDREPIDTDGEFVEGHLEISKVDAMRCEADGDPIDPDGEPVDLDGEPINADGEPLDPDGEPVTDGEPMDLDEGAIEDGDPIDPDDELL